MEITSRTGFAQRLREARNASKTKASAVAKAFEVSIKTVYAWEKGNGAPDVFRLRALCRMYKVSADVLLWGGDADAPGKPSGFPPPLIRRISRLDPTQIERLQKTVEMRLDELEIDAKNNVQQGKRA